MPLETSSLLATSAACPRRWLVVGKLLDTRHRRVLAKAHLVYDAKQILHCGEAPPGADLVAGLTPLQLPEFTALPGLIDGHTHVTFGGGELDAAKRTAYQKQDAETLRRLAEQRIQIVGQLGVAAIRDGGDKDGVGLALSRLTAGTEAPGFSARVFSPGAGIHRRGRYGAFFSRPVEDYADFDACVQGRAEEGADHIKIVPTGIINFAQGAVVAPPQFQTAEVAQFKSAAGARGKQLMAHASGALGIDAAIEGGADSIEHGYFITDEQLAKLRDRGTAWLPTFVPVQEQLEHADVMGWDAAVRDNLRRILENHARSLQRALTLGVNVLVGSDAGSCGVAHAEGLLREMELMQAAGMSALEVLCQATFGNQRSLPVQAGLGWFEAGRLSRFMLTEHDPLESVAALQRPRYVVFDGQVSETAKVSREGL